MLEKTRAMIDKVFIAILSIVMVILVLLALWQVFTRYVMNSPSIFTEELLRFAMVWMAMLGSVYAFSSRKHMALVFFKEKMKGARRLALTIAIDLLVMLFAGVVMVHGGTFLSSRTIHVVTPVLGFSMGMVYAIIPIAGVFIIMNKIMDMIIYCSKAKSGEEIWK